MPPNPGSPWRALIVAGAWYLLASAVAAPFVLLDQAGRLPPGMGGALAMLAVPGLLLVPVLRTAPLREWLRPPSAGPVQVVLAFALVLLVNRWLVPLLGVPMADIGAVAAGPAAPAATGWHLLRLAAIAVAAPLGEELFFRGWLWRRLAVAWSPPAVALATGLAFAAAHGQFAASVLPLTLALTWLRLNGGGLRAPLALHLAMNTFAAAVTVAEL